MCDRLLVLDGETLFQNAQKKAFQTIMTGTPVPDSHVVGLEIQVQRRLEFADDFTIRVIGTE